MNIYMIRQHLDQIERLRVKQPTALQSQEDIDDAIEYQLQKIEGLIQEHRQSKKSIVGYLNQAMTNADTEIAELRQR